MIQWHTIRVRTGLIVAAMTAIAPVITSAQTMERAAETAVQVNTNSTGDENSTDKDRSSSPEREEFRHPLQRVVQPDPGSKIEVGIERLIEVESQRRFNELRSKRLDDRAETINWWLGFMTVALGFFAIVAVVGGYLGFNSFRELKIETKERVDKLLDEIEAKRLKADKLLQGMTAESVVDDPVRASRTVKDVRENPEASLIDKAIAAAVSLQQQGKREEAIKKWSSIAHLAEEDNKGLAARAWFSIGYLLGEKSPEEAISAYDQVIRLDPDNPVTYYNRGNVKGPAGSAPGSHRRL